MKAKFGYIGIDEIEEARRKLVDKYQYMDGSWMEINIFVEKPHTGNIVRVIEWESYSDLLSESITVHEFDTEEEYVEFCEDQGLSTDTYIEALNNIHYGKTSYLLIGENGYECFDDMVLLEREILSLIEDGQYSWNGTAEEAYLQLCEWCGWGKDCNNTELLVCGVLR